MLERAHCSGDQTDFAPRRPRITFKNLEVLTEYFAEDDLLYQGRRRRIILSEQGFHTPDGTDGETIQASRRTPAP